MCQGTIVHEKTATSIYDCVALAPNCVANCSATPDKLFPIIHICFTVFSQIVLIVVSETISDVHVP